MKIKISFLLFLLYISPVNSDEKFSNFKNYSKTNIKIKLSKVVDGLNYPWGMTFIDKHNLIISQKNGKLIRVNINNRRMFDVKHQIQDIYYNENFFGQGGLLDVLFHNGKIYLSYSQKGENNNGFSTVIARGKLIKDKIIDHEILFVAKPRLKPDKHWGSRMVIKGNHLYASIGERDFGMIAQNPKKHPGSIIRINIDGTIPNDNPGFIDKHDWLPEIYLIGVRNPQGMTISPYDNSIFFSQHGPRGGDNLGKVSYAGNFGWKDIAWGGTEYYGAKIGTVPFKEKYNRPILTWVPSIGVGQINFYSGQTFHEWNDDLIVSATKAGLLFRLNFDKKKILSKEIIIQKEIGRIRDFEIDSKGDIYIIIDEENSYLWKLSR